MHPAFDHITEDPVHLFDEKGISLSVLRLDKIHPVISGNKWFKLKYYLQEALELHKKKIITFGGAWSNHIVATAAACKMNGLASLGIIRGEEPPVLSSTLTDAKSYGMQLYFTSREEYGEKKIPAVFQNDDTYIINEGGFGLQGVKGASDILNYINPGFTHCCCAVGTGTMMAGLIKAAKNDHRVIGLSVMKNNFDLEKNVSLLSEKDRSSGWEIIHDYHFGGYAKHQPGLIEFMNEFYRQVHIPSDIVYTGKLFYGISEMIKNNFFPGGSRLVLIHSGGLQGNASLKKGTLIY